MGKLQQSVGDRQARIVGILRHTGPATVQHLAGILRVDELTVATDVGQMFLDGQVKPLPDRVRGALQYRAVDH